MAAGYVSKPKAVGRAPVAISYEDEEERKPRPLLDVANLASPCDNCAIATRRLPRGLLFEWKGRAYKLSHSLLEGHRFAIENIAEGADLMSWSLPWGVALRSIEPGEYCCNSMILKTLKARRDVDFELPDAANFADADTSPGTPFPFDESKFVPGCQASPVSPADQSLPWTFEGYARGGGRGVGTRNKVVLIGATVASAGFVRALEARLAPWLAQQDLETIDGITSVAHNEGEAEIQNNKELILRTLAGFVVHPNTGAALVVAMGQERHITLQAIDEYMAAAPEAYPLDYVKKENLLLTGHWQADLNAAETLVKERLVPAAAEFKRAPQPVSALRIALQCGGSDAFSGVTGNPLVGEVAKELLTRGGLALLAESPELVGAEPYVLSNCASLDVARKFLMMTERYKNYAFRHGQDAAGNPSGGNLFRGLYNIVLKSLGASRKKPPCVCLDACVEYGERVAPDHSGYFFMDSPGNDLESIAGQVASGCNVIFFVTGNGAITNFPFVPTLKVVTTSGRFNILSKDMDVNAGALNDGMSMPDVAAQVYSQMIDVASGQLSKGEAAGHSQVSIWRNWFLDGSKTIQNLEEQFNYEQKDLAGPALKVKQEWVPKLDGGLGKFVANVTCDADGSVAAFPLPPFNLVLPTSLCSSQIARLACDRLNNENIEKDALGRSACRFASLPHTEGCGGAGGAQFETIFQRVMVGHLVHPQVQHGFLLEHGCEKTHNDWFAARLSNKGIPLDAYGWASVQLDGGIDSVCDRIREFFANEKRYPRPDAISPQPLRLGLLVASEDIPAREALLLATFVRYLVLNGATVLLPSSSPLLRNASFIATCLDEEVPANVISPTLAYAQPPSSPGLHVVEIAATMSWVETISGLGPAVHCFLTWLGASGKLGLQSGHPFVPTVHVDVSKECSSNEASQAKYSEADVTVLSVDDMTQSLQVILNAVRTALRGERTQADRSGAIDFSVARGITGVSL